MMFGDGVATRGSLESHLVDWCTEDWPRCRRTGYWTALAVTLGLLFFGCVLHVMLRRCLGALKRRLRGQRYSDEEMHRAARILRKTERKWELGVDDDDDDGEEEDPYASGEDTRLDPSRAASPIEMDEQ